LKDEESHRIARFEAATFNREAISDPGCGEIGRCHPGHAEKGIYFYD